MSERSEKRLGVLSVLFTARSESGILYIRLGIPFLQLVPVDIRSSRSFAIRRILASDHAIDLSRSQESDKIRPSAAKTYTKSYEPVRRPAAECGTDRPLFYQLAPSSPVSRAFLNLAQPKSVRLPFKKVGIPTTHHSTTQPTNQPPGRRSGFKLDARSLYLFALSSFPTRFPLPPSFSSIYLPRPLSRNPSCLSESPTAPLHHQHNFTIVGLYIGCSNDLTHDY